MALQVSARAVLPRISKTSLESLYLALGLVQVFLERGLQGLVRRPFCHLGQSFDKLLSALMRSFNSYTNRSSRLSSFMVFFL